MRDISGRGGLAAAILAIGVTAGCAHNDVLVFGTSTTIGLDVQTASTQGAAPSIVLGYRREEAVWMPLLVNANNSRLLPCPDDETECRNRIPATVDQALYRSTVIGPDGRATRNDTYSVFASLGARFSARANQGAEAGGGLAQFFATGNAALNVTENEALVTALKVEGGEGARAQADAVRAAGGATAESAFTGLSAAQLEAARVQADREQNLHQQRINRIEFCAVTADGDLRWNAMVDALNGYSSTAKTSLKLADTLAEIRARLETNELLVADLATVVAEAPFNCTGA